MLEHRSSMYHPHVTRRLSSFRLCCFLTSLLASPAGMMAADFNVTSPGFFFSINGENTPTLTLVRGRTYTFAVDTACGLHPFRINSSGTVNNSICTGTLTYTVPAAAVNYTYDCGVHGAQMQGPIITIEPPPPPQPPTVKILRLAVSTNLTVTSTGTNTWTVNPEYSTNLLTTNWYSLTVQSNRFVGGTNETYCGKPSGNNVFIRIRSLPLPN